MRALVDSLEPSDVAEPLESLRSVFDHVAVGPVTGDDEPEVRALRARVQAAWIGAVYRFLACSIVSR